MYWHARLDRAPDHVFRSATARKCHDQIGLAFVEHPLIAQWASVLADFVPLALRDLVRLARDAPARRPSISYPVCAARVTVDQHREELFGVQSIQDAAQFFKSVVGPVLVLSITRGAAITLMRI